MNLPGFPPSIVVHHPIASDLFLIRMARGPIKVDPKPVIPPVHHILCIDCSGSMSGELQKIASQIKKKLPKMLGEHDLVSVVWFSGRGEHGILAEMESCSTAKGLTTLNTMVDRWLKPVGLTGFKEPIEDVDHLVQSSLEKHPKHVVNFFFMSDGCDNQWPKSEIFSTLLGLTRKQNVIASSTFVEYGYYADRAMLSKMAETAGGSLLFAEDFDQYEPVFDTAVQKKGKKVNRVPVPIGGDPVLGFAFALFEGDLLTFSVNKGEIQVPEDLDEIAYLSTTPVGEAHPSIDSIAHDQTSPELAAGHKKRRGLGGAYAAVSLYATRMKPKVVLPLLKAIGDISFIEEFSTCFGKQRYSKFQEQAKDAALEPQVRFVKGRDPKLVPDENAFTLLDLLQILQDDDANLVLLDDPEFKYNRIGRKRVDADEDALKFVANKVDGYPIASLVWNQDRPNVSFMVRQEGAVDLTSKTLDNAILGAGGVTGLHSRKLPNPFPTFRFRNFTIVKDGLVNIDKLPVTVTQRTLEKLIARAPACWAAGAWEGKDDHKVVRCVFDLSKLPILNRAMVKDVKAEELLTREYQLMKLKAQEKVFNHYRKEHFPRSSQAYAQLYGADAAEWLKSVGLTDYNGFNPKQKTAAVTDYYMGKELAVSLKGLSALPTVKDAIDKKKNIGGQLMTPAIDRVEEFLKSKVYTSSADQSKMFSAFLDAESKALNLEKRKLMNELSKTKFAILVGQTWFSDFDSIEDTTMTIQVDGRSIECKVEMNEIKIEI